MEIRFAEKEDLLEIIDLYNEHAEYEKMDYEYKNKSNLLSNFLFEQSSSFKCLVVEKENMIIDYATFMKQFSTWDADYYIYLDCLFLKENARRKGLDRILMNRIKEYAKIVELYNIKHLILLKKYMIFIIQLAEYQKINKESV